MISSKSFKYLASSTAFILTAQACSPSQVFAMQSALEETHIGVGAGAASLPTRHLTSSADSYESKGDSKQGTASQPTTDDMSAYENIVGKALTNELRAAKDARAAAQKKLDDAKKELEEATSECNTAEAKFKMAEENAKKGSDAQPAIEDQLKADDEKIRAEAKAAEESNHQSLTDAGWHTSLECEQILTAAYKAKITTSSSYLVTKHIIETASHEMNKAMKEMTAAILRKEKATEEVSVASRELLDAMMTLHGVSQKIEAAARECTATLVAKTEPSSVIGRAASGIMKFLNSFF